MKFALIRTFDFSQIVNLLATSPLTELTAEDILLLKKHKKEYYEKIKTCGHNDLLGEEVVWRNKNYTYSELGGYWNCYVIPMCTVENFENTEL